MAIRLLIYNTTTATEIAGRNIPAGALPLMQEVFPGATNQEKAEAFLAWVEEVARAYIAAKTEEQAGDAAAVKAAADSLEAARLAKRAQVDVDWPEP